MRGLEQDKGPQHDLGKAVARSIHNALTGRRNVFALMLFVAAGVVIGRTLWEWGVTHLGLLGTLLVGILLFMFSGMLLHSFDG